MSKVNDVIKQLIEEQKKSILKALDENDIETAKTDILGLEALKTVSDRLEVEETLKSGNPDMKLVLDFMAKQAIEAKFSAEKEKNYAAARESYFFLHNISKIM